MTEPFIFPDDLNIVVDMYTSESTISISRQPAADFYTLWRTLASTSLTSDELPELFSNLDFCAGFGVDTGLPEVLVSGSGARWW